MKKLLTFLLFFLFLLLVKPVEAHFLATDGSIGAVLHVDPNDEPIAGSKTSFFFEFKDRQNNFKPDNCDCTFAINENGKTIYSQSLFQDNKDPNLNTASAFYTFPQKDVYQIKVSGKPKSQNGFQAFTLQWDFRVDQTAFEQTNNGEKKFLLNFFAKYMIFIALGAALILIFLIYFIRQRSIKKPLKKKGGDKNNEKDNDSNVY